MSHIFRHDEAAHCGRGASHHQDSHQLLIPEAQHGRQRQRRRGNPHQADQRTSQGRPDLGQRFTALETGSHGHQAQRRCQYPQVMNTFHQDFRPGQRQQRPDQSHSHPQDDGIGDDPLQRLRHQILPQLLPVGFHKGKHQHRKHIVEGNGTDQHQRRDS